MGVRLGLKIWDMARAKDMGVRLGLKIWGKARAKDMVG